MSAFGTSKSVVDGTTSTLHCGIHDFKTEELAKFHEHLKEEGHFDTGTVPCFICGKPFTHDKIPSHHVKKGIAMHPECKEQFIKEVA